MNSSNIIPITLIPATEPMQNPKLSNTAIQTKKKPITISCKGFIL
jgi:hypothetical protein